MAEPTLTLSMGQIHSAVGDYLGYGRGVDFADIEWTTHQTYDIERNTDDGLREFYCPSTQLIGFEYSWTFLTPVTSVTLSAGQYLADLPDLFAAIEGDVYYCATGTTNNVTLSLRVGGIGAVTAARFARPEETGVPRLAAVLPGSTTSSESGQRWQLAVFPTADQDYTLTFRMAFAPDALSTLLPYHYGGSYHSSTVKAACIAAAERTKFNERGVQYEFFRERMLASVAHDRRLAPQNFGYNGDRSAYGPRFPGDRGYYDRRVTVNGVQY